MHSHTQACVCVCSCIASAGEEKYNGVELEKMDALLAKQKWLALYVISIGYGRVI